MGFTRTQIGIAVGAGALIVFVFVGYLWWLSNQGPVLARSEDHDPLTGLPVSIRMNPLRDRTIENGANKFLREMRDGHCDELLSEWEHDYHKKYAHFICDSEAQHPLFSWELADWEDAPPLTILHYRGKRPKDPASPAPTGTLHRHGREQGWAVGCDEVRRDVLRAVLFSVLSLVLNRSRCGEWFLASFACLSVHLSLRGKN